MSERKTSFPGAERAAILLMSLGEKDAAQILKHMGPKEVQKVGMSMAKMTNVSKEDVKIVIEQFCNAVDGQTNLGVGSEEYIRHVLVEALGEEKAGGLIDRILLGANTKGLEALKWMDPRAVAEIIRQEHPQIIAIVLAYLESDQSAEILALMPEKVRVDVLMRIASLDGIPPAALQELNEIMEKQFSGTTNVKSQSVGGIKTAANILNLMDTSVESQIIDMVNEVDPDLSQKIQENMFIFDNLIELDDRGIQGLLRDISSDNLILALKGAEEAMKEKIFKNMSKRAADMLREDLEAKGPVRLSEVEAAQKEILAVARRMAEAGEISLGGKGGEVYV